MHLMLDFYIIINKVRCEVLINFKFEVGDLVSEFRITDWHEVFTYFLTFCNQKYLQFKYMTLRFDPSRTLFRGMTETRICLLVCCCHFASDEGSARSETLR